MSNASQPIVIYDLPTISRFFRSVALIVATQQSTRIIWQSHRDSRVINAIYTVLFWMEGPGFAEVAQNSAQINRRADELHEQYLQAWVRKLIENGPAEAQRYAAHMHQVREGARRDIDELFREASSINAEVIGETQEGIKRLAKIKLGAQVGVAVIGAVAGVAFVGAAAAGAAGGAQLSILGLQAGASSMGFTAVGAANSFTHSLIKTWEGGAGAKIAGVTLEAGKVGASEALGAVAGKGIEKALAGTARADQIISSAQGMIRQHSARLAQEGLKKKAAAKSADIVARSTAQVASQQAARDGFQRSLGNAARFGMAIPVVFAAVDIWDAVSDYRSTVAGAR